MATLGATNRTLLDLAVLKDPDGSLSSIAEVLTKDNEILLDAPWSEANDTFSHRIVRRAALPTGTWRMLNEGVAATKTRNKPVKEDIGMLDGISQSDIELVNAAPNPAEFRMQEAAGHIEGMSQTLASTLMYGNNTTDAEKFTGFAPRMASLVSAGRVLGASGSSASLQTSVYIIMWGLDKVHMVYPKGSSLGIEHEDRGVELVVDGTASVSRYRAYIDYFSLKAGLVVRDDRAIGRLANIETAAASNNVDADQLIKITNRMPQRGAGAAMYMNDAIISQFEIQAKDKTNVYYGPEDPFGREVLFFRKHPIRLVDAILNTEAVVS